MDPVTLVVAALVAGATKGLEEVVHDDLQAAYNSLKAKVMSLLRRDQQGITSLQSLEADPSPEAAETVRQALEKVPLTDIGPLEADAQIVLHLSDQAGVQSGKYGFNLREAQGVQIGGDLSNNTQHNNFR